MGLYARDGGDVHRALEVRRLVVDNVLEVFAAYGFIHGNRRPDVQRSVIKSRNHLQRPPLAGRKPPKRFGCGWVRKGELGLGFILWLKV